MFRQSVITLEPITSNLVILLFLATEVLLISGSNFLPFFFPMVNAIQSSVFRYCFLLVVWLRNHKWMSFDLIQFFWWICCNGNIIFYPGSVNSWNTDLHQLQNIDHWTVWILRHMQKYVFLPSPLYNSQFLS